MNRAALIRLIFAALIGALLASVLLGIISQVNAGGGFTLATVASARGWVICAIAGVITGVLAWTLLQPRRFKAPRAAGCHPTCPICGGAVGGDWRLCPHCGEIIR